MCLNQGERDRVKTVSVRQLARRLGVDPRTVRGILIGLAIHYERTPAADLVREDDARKVQKALKLYQSRASVTTS